MNERPISRKILIVEDDSRLRSGPGELLRQNGCEVVAAATGEQGMSHLRSERRADLIVSNCGCPGCRTIGALGACAPAASRPSIRLGAPPRRASESAGRTPTRTP